MIPGMPKVPPVLTHLDVERLNALVVSQSDAVELKRLAHELRRATVIPAHSAPADLVTMNSTVVYDDEQSAAPKEVTVVYPWRAGERGTVSVSSPLGRSLLGMRVGRSCGALDESSDGGALRIVAIAYQPEAAGDWHL